MPHSTATRTTYADLLKHPNWQRKRLEILDRNGFRCEHCDAEDKPLHVHHAYYEKGRKPWDYPDESLSALCEDCHIRAQAILTRLHRQIGKIGSTNIQQLLGYALGLEMEQADPCARFDVDGPTVAEGMADVFGVDDDAVVRAVIDADDKAISRETIVSLPKRWRFY